MMSVYNDSDPPRRQFEGNVSAFHIGKGYVISVAHYLHMKFPLIRSTPDSFFQNEILAKFPHGEANQLTRHFPLDATTQKRYFQVSDERTAQSLIKKFQANKCDTRVQTLYSHGVCKPFLIVQFRNNQFFGNPAVTSQVNPSRIFHEPQLNRYTFLLELELSKVFLEHDITLYRMTNVTADVIQALPSIPVDFNTYDDDSTNVYCLQSSPSNSNLGRLLNRAQIEGILDHWASMPDDIAGNCIFEGLRYLIRGYFRFGSSGAPYVKYDDASKQFKVIAVQSEACPIQLTIKNDREGNFQYVNALASPLSLVSDELRKLVES
jgi:hypothetical protein